MDHNDWIKDGSATTAPVTATTPELPTSEQPVAAVETAPIETSAAPQQPTVETAPATEIAAGAEAAAQAAAAAGATPAEQQQAAQEFIEAQLNGQPFQLPKGVMVPLKRGADVEWKPVEQVQREGMMERDYRIKTAELREQQRQFELQRKLHEARVAEQARVYQEQIERLNRANASPEEQLRMQTFAELAKSDPYFKQLLDDSVTGRVMQAERSVLAQEAEVESAMAEAAVLQQHITTLAEQYHVDPSLVQKRYSEALLADRAELTPQSIEQIAREEAAYAERVRATAVSPLQQQIEALHAQVQALTAAQAAAAHNASTQQAINRATTPVGAPLPSAGVPAPAPAASRISGSTLAERTRSWVGQ